MASRRALSLYAKDGANVLLRRHIAMISAVCLLATGCGSTGAPVLPTALPVATSVPSATSLPATPLSTTEPSPTLVAQTPTSEMALPDDPSALAALKGQIIIDGSSTVFPITEVAAIGFREIAPNVQIQLGVSGTGGGFKKFCSSNEAERTHISDASRPINADEIANCAEAGVEFIELPVAFDGLSVVVHPENQWARCMTTAELKTLWEPAAENTVTSWSQVREGWPDEPVKLYAPGRDSGTYDYFTDAIVGEEGSSRSDFIGSEDDYLLAQDVAADRNGLGFFGYAYYTEYKDRLRVVAIDGGQGCVEPNEQSIADGSYQPLSRPLFIYVNAQALGERPELRTFVDFYLLNAPQLVTSVSYIPLPARVYELAKRRVERRTTGTVFDGGPEVGLSIERLLEIEDQ